jgi:hypothetical protein
VDKICLLIVDPPGYNPSTMSSVDMELTSSGCRTTHRVTGLTSYAVKVEGRWRIYLPSPYESILERPVTVERTITVMLNWIEQSLC